MTEPLIILGGGLASVALTYHLCEPCIIVEAEQELGGLCRTYTVEGGHHYDIGGHVIFGEQSAVNEMLDMLDGNYARYERCNRILYNGKLIDFPFENGIWELSPQERYEFALNYFCDNRPEIKPTNFRDWLIWRYGTWLAHQYLIPFNEKLWKIDLRRISLDWTKRIPDPTDDEMMASACGIKRQGHIPLKTFYYPSEGGIGKLIEGYLYQARKKAEIKTMLGYRVTQINPKHNGYQIVCESPDHGASTVIEAERIISTIPAPELVKCLMSVPDEIYQANSRLQYLGLNIGYDYTGRDDGTFATYSASPQSVAHRVCNYGFFGGKVRTFETTVPKKELSQYPYSYPIYTHNRARDIKIILDYAKSLGIDCVGRMATMQYLNMDAVINQVKEYVKTSK